MDRPTGPRLLTETVGPGEPVLFIHGTLIADAFRPLFGEPPLEGYRLIHYHRRGYGGSERPTGPMGIRDQVADSLSVLSGLGVERAHIVGHSLGGAVALQLALESP